MKKKVVYILSNINKALAFEWIASSLNNDKFDLIFILLNPGTSELEIILNEAGVKVYPIVYKGKKDFAFAFFNVLKILKSNKPEVIHTHLFDASIIGLLAGKLAGVKKRIYTRHHSSYHHFYFPRAVFYDKFINSLATDIVAISGVVKDVLIKQEKVKEAKITLIPHGFLLDSFLNVPVERAADLSNKYNPSDLSPVIGVISRFIHLKGLQYTIPAFLRLLEDFPDAFLVLANASGDYTSEIDKLLAEIPARNYVKILFEPDLMALYQLFDVFVHVPINEHCEAFGQTYVEALAAGVPSVFTLSGIAPEFIRHASNAWVVPFMDTTAIYQGMKTLLANSEVANKIKAQGVKDVFDKFELRLMVDALEKLYA